MVQYRPSLKPTPPPSLQAVLVDRAQCKRTRESLFKINRYCENVARPLRKRIILSKCNGQENGSTKKFSAYLRSCSLKNISRTPVALRQYPCVMATGPVGTKAPPPPALHRDTWSVFCSPKHSKSEYPYARVRVLFGPPHIYARHIYYRCTPLVSPCSISLSCGETGTC